jgi:hypothetical protein
MENKMTTPAVHLKREEHARKNHFTIIAYKSDSTDTCMGCLMASWSSDFEMSFATTEEDAAIAWADIEDKKLEDREGGYEITLLINGLDYQHDYLEGKMMKNWNCLKLEIELTQWFKTSVKAEEAQSSSRKKSRNESKLSEQSSLSS